MISPSQTSPMQSPEWRGVRAVTVVCRVNGELGGGFGQSDSLEQDTRGLICDLAKQVIMDSTGASIDVRVSQRPDGKLLEADHAGIMIDAALERREQAPPSLTLAISSRIFRHNPNGPPGAFFGSPPKILIFDVTALDSFNIQDHGDAIQAVLAEQMAALLR